MITTLRQTACLHCGGAGLQLNADGQVLCKFCGTANDLPGTVCPRCECVSAAGAEFCENCQRPLFRVCPDCRTKNWSGTTHCARCGRPLDTLDGLIGRLQEDTDGRLNRQQYEATGLKALEGQAAERRLEQLRSIDQRREQAQSEAMARRLVRERQIITTFVVIVGLVVIVALAVIVLGLLPR
jgi:hypothetical protein